jgi:hypothetical protein
VTGLAGLVPGLVAWAMAVWAGCRGLVVRIGDAPGERRRLGLAFLWVSIVAALVTRLLSIAGAPR